MICPSCKQEIKRVGMNTKKWLSYWQCYDCLFCYTTRLENGQEEIIAIKQHNDTISGLQVE